ncbi:Efm4p Ecym_4320 [Eremothecium cymbalariae DBVPG|uniref:Protein-lysine N-methyltransferase EFM4 n=1 Tax=Eremothecium cymbalariae (strain CBS 270.75 / DBVPG 7215 / KCTC 17166 / NRRL Y-17582) TaxID=931890 RepID=G8JTN0_ERECY|nr:hypothetical protein Ecym_4320 [Eremothecium cymbalariae DBVPG\
MKSGRMEDTTKLNKSRLGTREYWEEFYRVEKRNFEKDGEDIGECWFSDTNATEKMVEFLKEVAAHGYLKESCSVLDVGSGNGHLLFELVEAGFCGRMVGVDYAEQSVEFAGEVLKRRYGDKAKQVKFEVGDVFSGEWQPGRFDVVLDKGTLDAIALTEEGRTAVEKYASVVDRVLEHNGVFLITSCNFTEEELVEIVEGASSLRKWRHIEYPAFVFGGVKGSVLCSVAFVKDSR